MIVVELVVVVGDSVVVVVVIELVVVCGSVVVVVVVEVVVCLTVTQTSTAFDPRSLPTIHVYLPVSSTLALSITSAEPN